MFELGDEVEVIGEILPLVYRIHEQNTEATLICCEDDCRWVQPHEIKLYEGESPYYGEPEGGWGDYYADEDYDEPLERLVNDAYHYLEGRY